MVSRPSCQGTDAPAALVFPGVGVRLCGRESVFFERHPDRFGPLLRTASERCGVDLTALLLEDRLDELSDGKRQLFTYAFSAGAADVAREHVHPRAAAGYSFGIYAALYSAGVLSFDEGLDVLSSAHRIMQALSKSDAFGMGVVVGLDESDLKSIIESEDLRSVVRTNTNHGLCHIFSGRLEEIRRFLEYAGAAGAFKFQRLEVDIPYHHPEILASAPARLMPHLEGVSWKPAAFPVVSTIDGALLSDAADIINFVARHLACPISWHTACETLHTLGVETALECGPGISLTQNGRFLDFEMRYVNVKKAVKCEKR